jgi:hypothetical protein
MATEVRQASADQAEFLAELIEAGLLLESGVPGIYGHSQVFEDVRSRLDERLTFEAGSRGAERLRFPPLLPRRQLESSGYLNSFPHLCGSVYSFEGDEAQAHEQGERAGQHEDWSEFQQMTDLALMPAACYPVYPAIANRGPLPPGGVFVDAGGAWVFRHEPSHDPARRQMFHQHELVRIAEPDAVLEWRDEWAQRGLSILRSLGLAAELDNANDPFFGRQGRMLAANQRQQALKLELLVQIAGPEPTALASFNHHRDHFGSTYGPHGLSGLRPRADRAGPAADARAQSGHVAGRGPGGALAVVGGPPVAASGTTRTHSLTGLDPATYKPHLLHDHSRTYLETNCYADIIIELLHACGYEPLAAFGHLVRMDFEGDQWTFFKPPPEDLEALFGIDIHEMQPYRPLPVQIAEQIELGRTMIVELDSWYLPDTASTSYRSEHVKTSCAFDAVDVEAQTLRYFHGAVLYDLEGDDYRGVFRIGDYSDDVLSPYTELVRFDAGRKLEGEALRVASLETLRYHLAKLPARNRSASFRRCWSAGWRTSTPTRLPPCGWRDPRSRSWPPTPAGCWAPARRRRWQRWGRSSTGARRCPSAWPGGGRLTPSRWSPRWPARGTGGCGRWWRRPADPWSRGDAQTRAGDRKHAASRGAGAHRGLGGRRRGARSRGCGPACRRRAGFDLAPGLGPRHSGGGHAGGRAVERRRAV